MFPAPPAERSQAVLAQFQLTGVKSVALDPVRTPSGWYLVGAVRAAALRSAPDPPHDLADRPAESRFYLLEDED